MTPRSFLQNQLRDQERAKLAALPTDAVLTILLSQKQAFDSSLTALSGRTIGSKGLDLLASSTSAAAINALGGNGGQIVSAMVASLDAAKLTGTIDVARLPVIPGNNSISATSIAGLTTLQQATVSLGTMVYTADGGAWRYSGAGSKTAEASYYYTADVTPEWNAIANKPAFGSAAFQSTGAFASAAQGAKADSAMQPGASSDVLAEGAANVFYSDSRVRAALLAGFSTGSNLAIAATDTVLSAFGKIQAQINAKFDKVGGPVTGPIRLESTSPRLDFSDTDAAAGAKRLALSFGSGSFFIQRQDDAGNFAANVFGFNAVTGVLSALPALSVPLLPDGDNSRSIGSTTAKWALGWFRQIQVGDDAATNALVNVNGAAGTERTLDMRTAGLRRWAVRVTNAAETGSNVGSDFVINRYNDAGLRIDSPITIDRGSGDVSFARRPIINGAGAIESQERRGVANGYAPLGADNLVPSSYLPASGSYKGNWNASTNTPTITAGVGTNGDEYTVSTAGTQSVTGTSTAFAVGDRLKFTTNGNKWERIPNSQSVSSVAGKTGVVVLAKADVGLGNVDNTSDANKPVSTAQQAVLDQKSNEFDTLDGGAI